MNFDEMLYGFSEIIRRWSENLLKEMFEEKRQG
jgi:hypothetical protein